MVRLLKPTRHNGKSYKVGDEFDIDEMTNKRWVENGIAEYIQIETQFAVPSRRRRIDNADNEVD